MPAFWSARDDKGELGVPGLHCTVGHLTKDSFDICASIVQNQRRYVFDPELLLDLGKSKTKYSTKPVKTRTVRAPSVTFHPKVHEYVKSSTTTSKAAWLGERYAPLPKSTKVSAGLKDDRWWSNWDDYSNFYDLPGHDNRRYGELEWDAILERLKPAEYKVLEVSPEDKLFILNSRRLLTEAVESFCQSEAHKAVLLAVLSEALGLPVDPTVEDAIDHALYF